MTEPTAPGKESSSATQARLTTLTSAVRRIMDAEIAVIAQGVRLTAGAATPTDFVCSASDASDDATAPSAGALLTASPFILEIASADGPLHAPGSTDVALQALLSGVGDTLGAPLFDTQGQPIGVALALTRGRLREADSAALGAILDLAGETLARATAVARTAEGSPDARQPVGPEGRQDEERRAASIASSAIHRRLLDTAADWICRIDFAEPLPFDSTPDQRADEVLDAALLGDVNVAFATRFGRETPTELEGTRVADLENYWLTTDRPRLAHLAASGFDRCEMTATETDSTGRSRMILARLTAEVDAAGIQGFWSVERDVTEHVDSLRRYRDTSELYGNALRASFDANCVLDADNNIVECDEGFAHLLGVSHAALVGTAIPPLTLSGKVRGRPMELSIEVVSEVGAWRGRGELTRVDGTRIPVDTLLAYFPRGRGFIHCFLRDLRGPLSVQKGDVDHQQALAQVARLSTLGEMTSGIAHELNQPLAAIVNYANGCVRRLEHQGEDDEVLVRALRSIVEQSRRAAEIIRRMRSFARRSDEKREPFSLTDLISEAVEITAAQRRRAGIELVTELLATPDDVVVDGIQIEQVALHLLRNAIDALERTSEDHPRTIRIETRIATCPGTNDPTIEASIIDSGQGVPEGAEVRLFDPFYTTHKDSLGLGLTISRSIIESHGGRLRFVAPTEAPSPGTCFRFTLPLRTAPIES